MLGLSDNQKQANMFNPLLSDFIDMEHELVLLADKIDWKYFENEFSSYYSHTGKPSMPVRLMVGCLMLKRIYNLGDETLVEAWKMNPYMQYFCGMAHFQHDFPCDPSDFVHFRKRIGKEGVEKIFAYSVNLHGKKGQSKVVLSDTTVQENNTTYSTDAKLAKKIIDNCNKLATLTGVKQRQSYKRKSKELLKKTYNSEHPKRKKAAKKATKKLKTYAGRLLRELFRKLPPETLEKYLEDLLIYQKVLKQKRNDKNKTYSLHKPYTCCIAKGKAHKKYEFGNKIGIMVNPTTGIILQIAGFIGNPHDSKTIEPLLNKSKDMFDYLPEEVVYDRGGRGRKQIGNTKISIPGRSLKSDTEYEKRKKRKKFRQRAGIEPIIGHLKKHFRMGQNYLHGEDSIEMNAYLAATGWNLKKYMKELKEKIKICLNFIFSKFFDLKSVFILSSS